MKKEARNYTYIYPTTKKETYKNWLSFQCRGCGQGTIRLVATPGRTWRYKHLLLDVPADFEIPTCDHCGEEWLEADRADELDKIFHKQYKSKIQL